LIFLEKITTARKDRDCKALNKTSTSLRQVGNVSR
jgi:hypothetical protein